MLFAKLHRTAHFINCPKREKVIVAASVLEEDHTGQHISEKLNQIIAKFNLTNNIHMGICDNAYNMQNFATQQFNYISINI